MHVIINDTKLAVINNKRMFTEPFWTFVDTEKDTKFELQKTSIRYFIILLFETYEMLDHCIKCIMNGYW